MLGHSDEAIDYVIDSASRHAAGFRFPAIWGPNYDWMPDQDHGTVTMSALQRMLLQFDGRKILLLPAWPKSWDADFKLCAISHYRRVHLQKREDRKVVVTPAQRRGDLVFTGP